LRSDESRPTAHSAGLLHSRLPFSTEVPMRVIGLAVVTAACLTLAPLAGKAQQAGRAYRIGYVGTTAPPAGFLAGLRGLGYVDGPNFAIDYRSSHGDV